MAKILGVDPGTYHFGAGCIEKSGNQIKLLFVEAISAPKKEPLYPRLGIIQARFLELLDLWRPDVMAIEDLFFAKNARSAFHLGLARGLAIAGCLERNIPIHEYSPTTIKSVVTGHGRADKPQVKRMVELQIGQPLNISWDASDALAAALCHCVSPKLSKLATKSPKTGRKKQTRKGAPLT